MNSYRDYTWDVVRGIGNSDGRIGTLCAETTY